jgi:hypothetical protein
VSDCVVCGTELDVVGVCPRIECPSRPTQEESDRCPYCHHGLGDNGECYMRITRQCATVKGPAFGEASPPRASPPREAHDHPDHYGGKDNPYETIKVIEAWGLHEDFCLGNVVKYVSRAGKKDPTKLIEDLKKARWYLDRRIEELEEGL